MYRFARCKRPLAMRMMNSCGLPLPESHIDVLEPRLRWEQLKVWILLPLPDVTSHSHIQYVRLVFHGFFGPWMADDHWLFWCQ